MNEDKIEFFLGRIRNKISLRGTLKSLSLKCDHDEWCVAELETDIPALTYLEVRGRTSVGALIILEERIKDILL